MADSIWVKIGFTINLVVDQLGAALFIPMVYIIVKYKKLHDSPCLKLIGILMFCCLCSKFVIIFPYLIRVLPLPNVPLILCFAIQIAPFSFVLNIVPITMAMAFDRCLSIFFPFWYRNEAKRLYFSSLCAFFSINTIYSSIPMFMSVLPNPMIQTNCTGGELFGAHGLLDFGSYMNYMTIFLYLLMVAKLLWDGRDGRKAYFKHQPIFVSFAVIIFIQVVGTWIITAAYVYIPGFFKNLNENEIPLVYYGINCLSSLLTTIQFWGIYLTSFHHRNVLKKELLYFCIGNGQNTAIQVKPILPLFNNNYTNENNNKEPVKRERTTVKF